MIGNRKEGEGRHKGKRKVGREDQRQVGIMK